MSRKLAQKILLACIPLLWLGFVVSLLFHAYLDVLDHTQDAANQIQSLQQELKTVALQTTAPLEPFRRHLEIIRSDLNFVQGDFRRYQPLLDFAKNLGSEQYQTDLVTAQMLLTSGQIFLHAGDYALDAGQVALDSFNELSQISIVGLDDNASTKSNQAIVGEAQLEQLGQDLTAVNQFVKQGMAAFNQLPYARLRTQSGLGRTVEQLRSQLANLSNALEDANTGLAVVRRVLGFDEPATFMILLNDADELRPNGGFAGNYILLTLWHGQIVSFTLENSYAPDDTTLAKGSIIVPAVYSWWPLHYAWGLRDVSLTPDWPDTVQNIQQLVYQEGVSGQLTGAIALNPGLLKNLLQTTGSVHVYSPPEYDEMVDAANFMERIHYHQAVDAKNQDLDFYQRKKFMRYLAQAMLSQLKQLPKTKLPQIGQDLVTALDQRDLLLYLADPTAQKFIDRQGWGGRLETGQDCLCVADTSESGNKTNSVVSQTISDSIDLNLDGNVTHKVTLNYNYNGILSDYQSSQFLLDHVAYNRFYIPAGSRIIAREGFDDTTGAVFQYGRVVWGQMVALHPGQNRNFEFSWQSSALWGLQAVGDEARYNLLVQRQPGANFYYHIEVRPPEGTKIQTIIGVNKPILKQDGSAVIFDGLLIRDLKVTVYFM